MSKEDAKKWYRRAAFWGFVLGLACHLLPPDYRYACQTFANICTGGF